MPRVPQDTHRDWKRNEQEEAEMNYCRNVNFYSRMLHSIYSRNQITGRRIASIDSFADDTSLEARDSIKRHLLFISQNPPN